MHLHWHLESFHDGEPWQRVCQTERELDEAIERDVQPTARYTWYECRAPECEV